jgi:hypothetical protein
MLNFKLFVKAEQEDPAAVIEAAKAAAGQAAPAGPAVPTEPAGAEAVAAPPAEQSAGKPDPIAAIESALKAVVDKDSSISAKNKKLNADSEGVVEDGTLNDG